jgi:iron-sulfur cluster assembly accessory protein
MKRAPIEITDAAKSYISKILADNKQQHLRVSISNKGCSGHKYEYQLMPWDQFEKLDEVVDWDGGRLVIDGMSLFGLIGSTLDLNTTDFESQLVWENPMSYNACGCGESFQLQTDFPYDFHD